MSRHLPVGADWAAVLVLAAGHRLRSEVCRAVRDVRWVAALFPAAPSATQRAPEPFPPRSPHPCQPDCRGWDVFDSDDELEIQRCDECWIGVPGALMDDDYARFPACQRALLRAERRADGDDRKDLYPMNFHIQQDNPTRINDSDRVRVDIWINDRRGSATVRWTPYGWERAEPGRGWLSPVFAKAIDGLDAISPPGCMGHGEEVDEAIFNAAIEMAASEFPDGLG